MQRNSSTETAKMRLFLHIFELIFWIRIVSAYDLFEGFFKMGKVCFPISQVPDAVCDTSLEATFTPSMPYYGANQSETLMYLFTPSAPNSAEPLHRCGGRLPPNTRFDRGVPTEVIIHGWLDGLCRTAWMREMKEQLFQRGHFNVILVDWTWGNTPDFELASQNCQIVGMQVGFVINNIMSQMDIGPEAFHVIGHSFGAIATGYAGREVNGKLGRITALDPSYAPFGNAPADRRLTHRDAEVVDIIHSNGAECLALGLGDIRQLGHADFYPNGGQIQLSCIPYVFTSFLKGDYLYALLGMVPKFCSHLQSLQYFKESINPKGCQFVGVASTSYARFKASTPRVGERNWAVMGMDYVKYRRTRSHQKYYLDTKLRCPYYDDSYLKGGNFPFNTSCST